MTIGPFDQTWYCNPDGYDIRRIRPYSAYDVGADVWVVKPPHLPHWSLSELPKPVQQVLRAADSYARHVLKLSEPERTQQGAALFEAWHSDRSRAFSDRGEGWWDVANLREKWGSMAGWWDELVACKRRADQGLDKAPEDWSNIPTGYTVMAATDKWPPYLTEREDGQGDSHPVNVSRSNPRGPVGTEEDARAAGLVGPFFHGTSKRRARDIRRNGFRQPRVHNWEMANAGTTEEVDMGHTHRTFFAEKHDDAHHFAQANHGDQVDVVKAYLHPEYIERDSGGGWMPSIQVRDVAHAMAINDRQPRRTTAGYEHRPAGPPRPDDYYEGGQPAHDLNQGRSGDAYGDGTVPGSRFKVRTLYDKADAPTQDVLRKARGNPEHPVTMYRALPHEHVEGGFHTGDWVSLSKSYAQSHARQNGGWPVIKATVPAKHLWTDGDYNEWGYHGPDTQGTIHTRGRQRQAKLPKTQKCDYCKQQATKRVLHAEGMAYIPVCDRHESRAKDEVGEDYCNTKPIPKVAALDAASSSWSPDMDIISRPGDDFSHRLLSGTLKSVKYPDEVDHPLYHGTRAELGPGDHVEVGRPGNFVRRMKHVYSAETPEGARQYGTHVYEVRPTGPIGHRSDARAENGYWASIFPLRVVRKVPHDEMKPRQATNALVLHLCTEGTPAHRIASTAGDPDQLMPHQAAVYRAQSAMTNSGKNLYHYLNHGHAQDMCRAVLSEQSHPHGDKLLVTHANPGRSYVKYDPDNSWPRIGLAPNHLHSHAVFHELAHVLTNGDHESASDEEAHGPAFVHTYRHLLDSYDSSAARQVFDEHYQPPEEGHAAVRQASTASTLYHWAPKAARDDIAEHGLDHRRAPGFDPARQGPHGVFMHHSEALARDWVPDIERTHDLYEVRASGLKLHPDPYDSGDASYTEHPVSPERLRRISSVKANNRAVRDQWLGSRTAAVTLDRNLPVQTDLQFNPRSHYRMIGETGFHDFLNTGRIRAAQDTKKSYDAPYFNESHPLDRYHNRTPEHDYVAEAHDPGLFQRAAPGSYPTPTRDLAAADVTIHRIHNQTGRADIVHSPDRPHSAFQQQSVASAADSGVTVRYVRNNGGMRHVQGYGQDVEPWGRYMSERSGERVPDGWEAGEVHFDNPLHVEHGGGAWKHRLSEEHGGQTGKELSSTLLAKGHDAVITHDKHGIGEIVDIRPREQRTHQVTGSAQVWITPQLVMGSAAGLNHARAVNSASEVQSAISEGLTAVLPVGSWFIARQALQALGMPLLDVTQRLRQLGAPV